MHEMQAFGIRIRRGGKRNGPPRCHAPGRMRTGSRNAVAIGCSVWLELFPAQKCTPYERACAKLDDPTTARNRDISSDSTPLASAAKRLGRMSYSRGRPSGLDDDTLVDQNKIDISGSRGCYGVKGLFRRCIPVIESIRRKRSTALGPRSKTDEARNSIVQSYPEPKRRDAANFTTCVPFFFRWHFLRLARGKQDALRGDYIAVVPYYGSALCRLVCTSPTVDAVQA